MILALVLYLLGGFASFYTIAQFETISVSIIVAVFWPLLATIVAVLLVMDSMSHFLESR